MTSDKVEVVTLHGSPFVDEWADVDANGRAVRSGGRVGTTFIEVGPLDDKRYITHVAIPAQAWAEVVEALRDGIQNRCDELLKRLGVA